MRILVIDSHDDARAELAATLLAAGHRVVSTASVAEGLDHLRQIPAEVAIVEIRPPDMSGLEAVKAVRRSHPDIRVVSVSGCSSSVSAHSALTLALAFGADRAIYRPFRPDELLAALEPQS